MAKRTPARSQTNDDVTETQAQSKVPRSRAKADVPGSDVIGTYPGVESVRQHADSRSMAFEPSEEDIRTRAYHRYLQRGGNQGTDFEDWLEAERELKRSKA